MKILLLVVIKIQITDVEVGDRMDGVELLVLDVIVMVDGTAIVIGVIVAVGLIGYGVKMESMEMLRRTSQHYKTSRARSA